MGWRIETDACFSMGQRIETDSLRIKGTVPRDFRLLVLFMNQFPPSTWVYHYGHFKFFRKLNSRRYTRLKVHHRCPWHWWQLEKILDKKNFNYFVWTPLGSRVNIYINFCLQVHFKVSAAWYYCHYLPPMSLTPVANLPPVSTTLAKMVAKFATSVVYTGGKFAAGVVDTGGKFATGVVDTGGAPWLANISANFQKNLKRSKWDTLGLWGNWFMKKTRSKKSRDTVPLNQYILKISLRQILIFWSSQHCSFRYIFKQER